MESEKWIEIAEAACRHAGIESESIETFATWDQEHCANAVYRIDGVGYLKLFGPDGEWQFHIERSVLHELANHDEIPAPRIIAERDRAQGPPYLFMTEIPGSTAEDVWESLSRSEQLAIAREIGEITAAIHRLPQGDLAAVERRFGGMAKHTKRYRERHLSNIKATESLTVQQRENILRFLHVEAWEHLHGPLVLAHFDLAHNHIYLSRNAGTVKVTGFIDWGEAMLGPAEWDIAYLWFWTFSGDQEAMRECLKTFYSDRRLPEHFARRCLAAVFHTSSMSLLWPRFVERGARSNSITRDLTEFLFPEELFGPPD